MPDVYSHDHRRRLAKASENRTREREHDTEEFERRITTLEARLRYYTAVAQGRRERHAED